MDGLTIVVDDLTHRWPGRARNAVDGMDFTVAEGEVFGLLGPSGAGKTTTQQILTGLVHGWSGRVEVLGRPLGDWGPALYDRIGLSFELPVGWPRLTGREDLVHFAALHDRPARDLDDLFARVGLADVADLPVGTWSRGMRTRLNLARAMLHRPDLLFLDEPTGGLDPVNVAAVRDLVRGARDEGATIVLATHDMATADALCDRVAFVVDGRIVACDRPRTLRRAHGEATVEVEHRVDGRLATTTWPLPDPGPGLAEVLASGTVEAVSTNEATLDRVFVDLTGRAL